jgi:hypothetical protein
MRRLMLIANPAVAVFFMVMFAYTFLGRRHVDHLARDFVTGKTQMFAATVVDLAEEAIKTPLVRKLLTNDQVGVFDREVAEFRRNPADYVAELTGQRVPAGLQQPNNPLLAKVLQWKQKVRDYYDLVLSRLLVDLRIFAGSNLVAAAIATWLATRADGKTAGRCDSLSFLLFAAVAYSVSVYIDRISFFTILFNSHLGWWYPGIVAITFISLILELRRS